MEKSLSWQKNNDWKAAYELGSWDLLCKFYSQKVCEHKEVIDSSFYRWNSWIQRSCISCSWCRLPYGGIETWHRCREHCFSVRRLKEVMGVRPLTNRRNSVLVGFAFYVFYLRVLNENILKQWEFKCKHLSNLLDRLSV